MIQIPLVMNILPNATVLSKYKLSQISRNFLNTLYIKLCDFIFKSKSIRELISNLLRIESYFTILKLEIWEQSMQPSHPIIPYCWYSNTFHIVISSCQEDKWGKHQIFTLWGPETFATLRTHRCFLYKTAMRNYFHAITFAKFALAKRDNHGRKISVNGPVSGRRKEKKNSGILQNKWLCDAKL